MSLRALYNPQTYSRARHWTEAARRTLGPRLYKQGRPYFEGAETGLGLGLLRVVPSLSGRADVPTLLGKLRAMPNRQFALMMLDTGETPEGALAYYDEVLAGADLDMAIVEKRLSQYAGDLAARGRRPAEGPNGSKKALIKFLEQYHERVFAPLVQPITEAVDRAARSAGDLLAMAPTNSSVEALSGGYVLSTALRMTHITLAPSVFVYPYMASRIDETEGTALIVFGVKSDDVLGYRGSGSEDVLSSVKALASSHRLQILTLLREDAMLGTEVVKSLGLSQATVHHHLAQLRSGGLIRQERTPEGMRYSFRPDGASYSSRGSATSLGSSISRWRTCRAPLVPHSRRGGCSLKGRPAAPTSRPHSRVRHSRCARRGTRATGARTLDATSAAP